MPEPTGEPAFLWSTEIDTAEHVPDAPLDEARLCWHCCHPFESEPLQFPFRYDQRRDAFRVGGAFCSWECLKAYGRDSVRRAYPPPIDFYHKRVTGTYERVRPAPPRCVLKSFGGHMSIREFRENLTPLEYKVTLDNLVQVIPYMAEIDALYSRNPSVATRKPPEDFAPDLKLARPKPLTHTTRITIDRALGLNSLIKQRKS